MKTLGLVRGAAVSLAALGMMVPQVPAYADNGAKSAAVVRKADSKVAADVKMVEGAFTGRVVDHNGTPLADREVLIKQGDKEVARVKSDEKGVFSTKTVRPGLYTATAGNTTGTFRVWNEKSAPPIAKGHALLVMGENGARGQFGAVDPTLALLTAAIIASVIISAITLDKVNDVDDKVSQIPTSP